MRRTKRLPLEELAPYLWESPTPESVAWPAVFGNANPIEIEVGFGKGLFLLNSAIEHPETNYFGIEIVRKYQLFTATRMAVRKLTNVRLACGDANVLIRDRVPAESVRAIHVYFPDPWWKKRHHKRRVFTAEFVDACVRAVVPGGHYHLATDVAEYFEVMTELCAARPELELLPRVEFVEDQTNFERKARAKRTPINRAIYRRR